MKIAVVTDSASGVYDLPQDIEGLFKLPMQVSAGDQEFLAGETINRIQIYDLLEKEVVLKTSLPPLGRIENLFEQLKAEGYDAIYSVVMSSGLSSTLAAMEGAAKTVDIDFYSFDIFSGAEIELMYAMAAREMFDKDFSVEKVTERLTKASEGSATYIVADDLRHLVRSGRLTARAAILGGLLRIKPIMYLGKETGGRLEAVAKPRTMKRALDEIVSRYVADGVDKDCVIFINHVKNLKMANLLKDKIIEQFGDVKITVKDLVMTVSIHVGLGGVATQFSKRINTD